METAFDLTDLNRARAGGVSYFGQATSDDLSDVSEIVSDGVQLGGGAAQISDGGLILILFSIGAILWLMTHKQHNARKVP